MGIEDHDVSWILTQLTVARWHLDAAVSAAPEDVRENLKGARRAFDSILRSVSQACGEPTRVGSAEPP